MEFIKYSSIENSSRKKVIDAILNGGYGNHRYVVQEKAHGANFQIFVDDNEHKSAKRSGFNGADENFYGAPIVMAKYRENLNNLWKEVKSRYSATYMVLCGEIIGGNYKHESITRNLQAVSVQKGVMYCADNEFYGFDMRIDDHFINVDDARDLCVKYGIPFAEPLMYGTMEECMEYPNEFNTRIPELYGLPPIPGNICEGVVIKPVEPIYIGDDRVILKNKNEKFQEKHKENKKHVNSKSPLRGDALEALNELQQYITENRLRNVLSKIGPVTNKDFGKIMGLFAKDCLDDFEKDSVILNTLGKDNRKKIWKELINMASILIRNNLVNIIDGNF